MCDNKSMMKIFVNALETQIYCRNTLRDILDFKP